MTDIHDGEEAASPSTVMKDTVPPEDAGAETFDRYEWQAAMAAADILAALYDSLDDDGVLRTGDTFKMICEHHEDWALNDGRATEIVSAKHKETETGAFTTIHGLLLDGGMLHLLDCWLALRRTPNCRIVTTAGVADDARELIKTATAFAAGTPDGEEYNAILDKFGRAVARARTSRASPTARDDNSGESGTRGEDRATLAAFLRVLRVQDSQPTRKYVPLMAPSAYAQPVAEKMLDSGASDAVWSTVLGLVRERMRAAGRKPRGLLPAVLGVCDEPDHEARVITLTDVTTAIRTMNQARVGHGEVQAGSMTRSRSGGKQLPKLGDVSLQLLGVKEPRCSSGGRRTQFPYVTRRKLDAVIEECLLDSRFILVHGPSASGKSRSAAEVAKRIYPDRHVFIPSNETDALGGALDSGSFPGGTIVWLDDLDRHLDAGVNLRMILRVLELPKSVIVGTIRAAAFEKYKPQSEIRPRGREIIDLARLVTFAEWDGADMLTAAAQLAHEQHLALALSKGISPSQFLVACPDLVERLTLGTPPVIGVAIVRSVADWFRSGLSRPAPLEFIQHLHTHYVPSNVGNSSKQFEEGMDWACTSISGMSLLKADVANQAVTINDYILDYLTAEPSDPVPAATWNALEGYLLSNNASEDLTQVGATAYLLHELGDLAERLTRRAADLGNTGAMVNLANFALERQEERQADEWLNRAMESGSMLAAYNLGILREQQGRMAEAERLYQAAASNGDPQAMTNLANLLVQTERRSEAKALWHKASEFGVSEARFNLGRSLKEEGRADDAAHYWLLGARGGDTNSMNSLGVLYSEQGRDAEARELWSEAASRNNHHAMNNMGNVSTQSGNTANAEEWYLRAISAGNLDAINGLAVLLMSQGEVGESERLLRQAAEMGVRDAMNNLADYLYEHGDQEEAHRWRQKAQEN